MAANSKPADSHLVDETKKIAEIDARIADLRKRSAALQQMYDDAPTFDDAVRIGASLPAAQDAIGQEIAKLSHQRAMLAAGVAMEEPKPVPRPVQKQAPPRTFKGETWREQVIERAVALDEPDDKILADLIEASGDYIGEYRQRLAGSSPAAQTDSLLGHIYLMHRLHVGQAYATIHRLVDRIASLETRLASMEDQEGEVHRMFYAGAWNDKTSYERGAVVQSAGSAWVALAKNFDSAPGADDHWRMLVRRGRNGKDADSPDAGPLVRLIENKFAELRAELMAPVSTKQGGGR